MSDWSKIMNAKGADPDIDLTEPVERQGERDPVLEQWRLRVRTLEAQLAQVERVVQAAREYCEALDERVPYDVSRRAYDKLRFLVRQADQGALGEPTDEELKWHNIENFERADADELADQGASDE